MNGPLLIFYDGGSALVFLSKVILKKVVESVRANASLLRSNLKFLLLTLESLNSIHLVLLVFSTKLFVLYYFVQYWHCAGLCINLDVDNFFLISAVPNTQSVLSTSNNVVRNSIHCGCFNT